MKPLETKLTSSVPDVVPMTSTQLRRAKFVNQAKVAIACERLVKLWQLAEKMS